MKIPEGIPPDTVRLDLQENKIYEIKKDDFAKLGQLKILQLMDNEIHLIEEHAFDNLTNLERLRLNRNRLRNLPDHLFIHNEKLHRLDLSENYLSIITDDQLQGPKNMRNLQLDRNQLTCLDSGAISKWTDLEILTLNGNSLTTLGELENASNLRVLRLVDNPWQCDCRLKWMKHMKYALVGNVKCHRPALLQGRSLENVNEQYMKCSGIEKRAATSCREARVCPSVCTCTETTVDCRDRGLKHIPANLPISTTELRLEQNQITFIPSNAIQSLEKLRRLDMSKNMIKEIHPDAFNGLTSLNTLVLYGNNLTDLPSNVFRHLSSLQLLLLNANRLSCLRRDTFKGLSNLNLLSLYDNQIKSISNGTFEPLVNLQTLHLARNPLICDCNLEWLALLLTQRPIETSGAKCEAPKRVAKKRLTSLQSSKFRCKGSEVFVTKHADECVIDYDCPSACFCHQTVVDCSGRGLTEIPHDVPFFTTELRLNNNRIEAVKIQPSLDRLQNLEKLDLSNNKISSIEDNALANLKALKELHLSSNRLRHFSSASMGHAAKNLQVLTLSNNQLRCITEQALANLDNLHSLYLSNNQFACNCHLADFINYLKQNASSRLFDIATCSEPTELKGRPIASLAEKELICNERMENVCAENGNYCPSGCTCQDTIVRCSNKNLKEFPLGIPPDTTELYLDINKITHIPIGLLSRLTQLIKLDLSQNEIAIIQNSTFQNLTKLSTLILSYNKLQCLEETSLWGLYSLRILSLHGNNLSRLPESAFSHLTNITHIALGSNALYCDCHMAWFSKWIKAKFVEPGIAKCEAPESVKNQLLLTANNNQFKCNAEVPKHILAKCDACAESVCQNKGVCVRGPGRTYQCNCPVGFHGKNCEHEIDACYGEPCLNNATCKVIQEGRFKCHCAKGFTGERCETNMDDCVKNKCENGATCVDGINSYTCLCPHLYKGNYCEDRIAYCSKDLNPCENNGKCMPVGRHSYSCLCPTGYNGQNCSTNIDDCEQNLCRNSGICIDGINSYTCQCPIGYTGEYCEAPLISNSLYRDYVPPCGPDSCERGQCILNEDEDHECECFHGFSGPHCNQQMSVGFDQIDSYVALEPWDANPKGNLTLTVTTTGKTGVIAYYGDKSYFSAELFDGRIKIAFYVGNYPPSFMYSFVKVNDGLPHTIQILINGNQITMLVDGALPQTITNYGKVSQFATDTKQNLYVGGIPHHLSKKAMAGFHLKQTHSLHGCISNVYVNDLKIDFVSHAVELKDILDTCVNVVDLCRGVDCGPTGTCVVNATTPDGYYCKCENGYSGKSCEKRVISCNKEKYRYYHEEGDCRSIEQIKSARCLGWCGEDPNDAPTEDGSIFGPGSCCAPVKQKRRRVKMHCKDGGSRTSLVNIIRKCQCTNECAASAN
uniref:Protein slit n=1 Tax=Acrobeloides nanus TaxID=290746 RepID=A0A914CNL9_9BILA